MTTGDEPISWELGEQPGECLVQLGVGRRLAGIHIGGPENAVVIGVERLVPIAGALLEAAGLAGHGSPPAPVVQDLRSVRADMASIRSVINEAAKRDQGMTLGASVVKVLADWLAQS